jgi:diguanylate cyclase (GGDEF)-like protein/PAS domain S-box-containing protein
MSLTDPPQDFAQALAASHLDLQALIDAAPGVSVLIDLNGNILVINQAGARHFGIDPQAARGCNLYAFFPQTLAGSRRDMLDMAARERRPLLFEDSREDRDYRHSTVPVIDADGEIRRLAIFTTDITEQNAASAELRKSEAQYRFLAENSADVAWQLDTDLRFVYISKADENLRGIPREQVIGTSVWDFYPPQGKAILLAAIQARNAQEARGERVTQPLYIETPQLRRDGSEVWVETVSTRIYDENGTLSGYIGVTRNIEERRRYQAMLENANQQLQVQLAEITALQNQLQEKAMRDGLTGLYNRHYLHETLPRELARAEREALPLAVVMIDIDHFKAINDTHGHMAGDQALQRIAEILQHLTRESDLVCRFGGEEFLVALPGLTLPDALARTETWRTAIAAARLDQAGQSIRLTASQGIATFPEHGRNDATLLANADAALYAAKRAGRDRICVYAGDTAPPTDKP